MCKPICVGVLALQGDIEKHRNRLSAIDVRTVSVRYPDELERLDGLVIPGGESTTIGMLMARLGLIEPLRNKIRDGLPVFGTCAGAILLARNIIGRTQETLDLMNIGITRNAYGRQVESFEADIAFPVLGGAPVRSVFIRAPIIEETGPEVEILGEFEGKPVLVRERNMLAATFHPELTDDSRVHSFFIEQMVRGSRLTD